MKSLKFVGALGLVLMASVPAFADFSSQTFTGTAINSSSATGSAVFSLTGNVLTIKLANTASSIGSIADILTGVSFNFLGGTAALSADPTTSSTAGYTCSGPCAAGTVTPNPWQSNTLQNVTAANSISIFGVQPKGSGIANDAIIGKSNGSLNVESPFLKGTTAAPAIFTVTLSGNYAGVTGVSDVFLNFGTIQGGSPVPEPGFYGLLTLGISGLMFVGKRRRNSSSL